MYYLMIKVPSESFCFSLSSLKKKTTFQCFIDFKCVRIIVKIINNNNMILIIILFALAIGLLYRWSTINYDFFKSRGIPYHRPFPMLGSFKDMIFRTKSMFDIICDLYYMDEGKVFGIFDQRKPLLMVKDPELIKQITIKDFDHFVNHRTMFVDDDNLFASSMFLMQDGKWKDMRSTLSPFFTGSKMRQMFHLINQVAQESNEFLKKQSQKSNTEIDLKDFFTRFTNDIIASTAFGLQVNSFVQSDNEFYKMGKKVTNFSGWQNLKFFLFASFGGIMKFFKIKLFDEQSTAYFMHLVLDAMKYRADNNIHRPDMINMLMEARQMVKSDHPKSHNRDWTDVDIVAQCFLFFFAGFETSSVLMCFAAHELMENPETQQKLFEEIEEVHRSLDGKELTYEALQGMKYMEMVLAEVLRKWPAAIAADRVCSKDYSYETEDGYRFEMKQGEALWIPMGAIQRDPKYYDNPNQFDPERFNEDNKDDISQFTYLPFGLGPRNCIGSRFALLEAKAILYYLLRDNRFEAASKTTIPMKLSAKSFQLLPINGFWLKFVPRETLS